MTSLKLENKLIREYWSSLSILTREYLIQDEILDSSSDNMKILNDN